MKACRFVLAIPHDAGLSPPREIASVPMIDIVCASGVRLWTDGPTPVIKPFATGFVVGALFSKQPVSPVRALHPASAYETPALAADWLVRECWGAYFAIFTDQASDSVFVMVDPSGLFPVYRFETSTHILFASHPALLGEAVGVRLRVCWRNLRSQLLRPELRQRSTCLAGVTELAPAELVPVQTSQAEIRRLWLPDDFIPQRDALSYDDAREHLRSLAVCTIGAWADLLGPVAVAASGGVDSSFICGALKQSGTPFTCVTVATADASGDERPFVEMLGRHLGVRTVSAIYDPRSVDPKQSASAGLARPSRRSFIAALDAALSEAGTGIGAEAIFDGNAGDNLFCFLHSAAPVVDRLRCEGPGRGALVTLLDMCRLTGCDIPAMARAVGKRMVRQKRRNYWPADLRLLTDGVDGSETLEPLLPWLDTPVGRHQGKRDHLAFIMRNQNHIHGLGASGLPRFSPLMSQPLLEFCLGVPTWLWCTGGINRALARAAFADTLPPAILARSSKSGPDSFVRRSFHENRSVIRDLLMEGLLAKHAVIDRIAVDAALNTDVMSVDDIVYRLLDLAEAENWARSWDR